jgi:hypothetical protein
MSRDGRRRYRDAADTLADTLRFGGFEVATVFDGLEALKLFERFSPDVAILDIGLPSMDGLDLAPSARRERHARDSPYRAHRVRTAGRLRGNVGCGVRRAPGQTGRGARPLCCRLSADAGVEAQLIASVVRVRRGDHRCHELDV